MSDIFISYASKDRAEAKKLANALEKQGWSVWWDRSIPIGKSYENVIEAALDEALCVIVIWSKISVKSEWVRAEVAEARNQEKLFPINIDDSKPPLVYRSLQTADFTNWFTDGTATAFNQLVADIKIHIGQSVSKVEPGSDLKVKITIAQETGSNINNTGENWIEPAAVSLNEQTPPSRKAHKSYNRSTFVIFFLLLSLFIGGGVLSKYKTSITTFKKILFAFDRTFFPEAVIEPEMVPIPQGCFQMGSPESDQYHKGDESLHEVCVEAFRIGKYEVSFNEYDQLCSNEDCRHSSDQAKLPVDYVSWENATAYAEWLSGKTGKSYRLPTEAEWEYAARGNKQPQTRYPWGNEIENNKANCDGCGSQWDYKTVPVGSFAANDFGLYDTVGNVSEWTCSLYKKNYEGFENKCVDIQTSKRRVYRGLATFNAPTSLYRSATRAWNIPSQRNSGLGFRLAQDLND